VTAGAGRGAALAAVGDRVRVGDLGVVHRGKVLHAVTRIARGRGVAVGPVVSYRRLRRLVIVAVAAAVTRDLGLLRGAAVVLGDEAATIGVHVVTGTASRRVIGRVRRRTLGFGCVQVEVLVACIVGDRDVALGVCAAGRRRRLHRLQFKVVADGFAGCRAAGTGSRFVGMQRVQVVALVTARAGLATTEYAAGLDFVGDVGRVHRRRAADLVARFAAVLLPVGQDLRKPKGAHVVVALTAADRVAVLAPRDNRYGLVRVAQVARVTVLTERLGGPARSGQHRALHVRAGRGVCGLAIVPARVRIGDLDPVLGTLHRTVMAGGALVVVVGRVARNATDALIVVAGGALGIRVILVEVDVLGLSAVAAFAGVHATRFFLTVVIARGGELVDIADRRVPRGREHDDADRDHADDPTACLTRGKPGYEGGPGHHGLSVS